MIKEQNIFKNDLILSFKNDFDKKLFIIIDPPCSEFQLFKGQVLKLIIHNYRVRLDLDISKIIDFRYEGETFNIDVNFDFSLSVEIDNKIEKIWG